MAGRPMTGPPVGPPLLPGATRPDPHVPAPAEPGPTLRRARSALPAALMVEVALLAITGIALWFVYRPTAQQAWSDITISGSLSSSEQLSQGLRISHRLIGGLAILTAAATAVALSFGPGAPLRRIRGRLVAATLVVATIAAMFTGYALPWDQLALRAVSVGTNITGYRPIFGDDVRFVLIGGIEVDPGTLIRWLLVHTALLGPLVIGLATVLWRRRPESEPVS